MNTIINWLLATRPKTLVACVIPVVCATALAYRTHPAHFSLSASFFILLSALCIQIGTNFTNDVIDFQKGADTAARLGPTRMCQSGLLKPKVVINAAILMFGLAILFGLPLVLIGGMPIVWIGLFSILCAYCYTGGPYPLAYHGLGEFFVFLFFGYTAVCGTYYLQTHTLNMASFVLATQIGALSSVILVVNNYRDYAQDKMVKKMTLAARFGKKFARFEILFFFLLTYLLNIYWFFYGNTILFFAATCTLPISYFVTVSIFTINPSQKINKLIGISALNEFLFGIFISLGFLYSL